MKSQTAPLTGALMLLVAALGLCAPTQTVNVQVGSEARMWVGPLGRATADAREALALLGRAREEGLDPDDYDAAGLHRAAGLLEGPESSPRPLGEPDRIFDSRNGRVSGFWPP